MLKPRNAVLRILGDGGSFEEWIDLILCIIFIDDVSRCFRRIGCGDSDD